MRTLIVFVIVAAAVARPDEAFYDQKYDNFNVEEVTSNLRLLKSYAQCFLDTGKCTPEGNDFKKWIPEGIQTECAKCTDKQKTLVGQFIKAIKEKLPTEYNDLSNKYNPGGKYDDGLNKFLEKYGN